VTRTLRLARVLAHLAAGCAISALAYPLLPAAGRGVLRRRWARGLLRILGVRLQADPPASAGRTLLVANHVSWLDAVALHARLDCAMVAKSEAGRWPLLGALLARNETLFVERRVGRHLLALNAEIAARLARGATVALFPEGTTTGGDGVLPFRTALFEPAIAGGHAIQALALHYRHEDGRPCREAAFIDEMSLWQSLVAVAGLPGLVLEVRAVARFSGVGLCRRRAAALAHAAVQDSVRAAAGGRQAVSGLAGSASAAGAIPSSAGPTWASSAEVSRT
jgi:1-acyl-sn-glycerol-3-phosphate acyltransferase